MALPSALQQAINALANSRFNLVAQMKALPEYVAMQRNGVQTPNYLPSAEEKEARWREGVRNNIRNRFVQYGGENLPALEYVNDFVDATQKYPFFRNNPYLLPQISILETSGGQNITRPNNLLNWGISIPYNNQVFSQMTPREVLERAISGLGERSDIYKIFRTGAPLSQEEINTFAGKYQQGNPNYANDLWSGMQLFQSQ